MPRGILTVGEGYTFEDVEALSQVPGMITSMDQIVPTGGQTALPGIVTDLDTTYGQPVPGLVTDYSQAAPSVPSSAQFFRPLPPPVAPRPTVSATSKVLQMVMPKSAATVPAKPVNPVATGGGLSLTTLLIIGGAVTVLGVSIVLLTRGK